MNILMKTVFKKGKVVLIDRAWFQRVSHVPTAQHTQKI